MFLSGGMDAPEDYISPACLYVFFLNTDAKKCFSFVNRFFPYFIFGRIENIILLLILEQKPCAWLRKKT